MILYIFTLQLSLSPSIFVDSCSASSQVFIWVTPEDLEQDQRRTMKLIRGLKQLSHEGRLRKLGFFIPEKRMLCVDLIATFQCLKVASKEAREGPFVRNYSDRTRTNGYKLKEGKFRLHIQKKFFIIRVVVHWQRLSREAVDALSLAIFRVDLDGAVRLELGGL